MTSRRSDHSGSKRSTLRGKDAMRRRLMRGFNVEILEDRRLMALGPQLVGIQPDDGRLLSQGEILNVAPLDLTFQFDQATQLDFATMSGIQIWRSGLDNQFSAASVSSDFGTAGAVELTFRAKALGPTQNGIALAFSKADLGNNVAPRLTVTGSSIAVVLNSNALFPTTGQRLVDALNANTDASALLVASVSQGSATANISLPAINYSPLTLTGANAASVVSDLGSSNAVRFRFTATPSGEAGNGTQLIVNKGNLGIGIRPTVAVNGKIVTVTLNNSTGSKSTATDLLNAINGNTAASAVLQAAIISGNRTADIATNVVNGTTLTLAGSNDVLVVPGYAGRGQVDREAVLRFKETLVDDKYHIDVFGSGPLALRNQKGEPFNNGRNFQRDFELDLGAQVIAIVPQPVDRAVNGVLSQRRNQIDVYFNNDDLFPSPVQTGQLGVNPSVVNPSFYQLIFTRDTVENTDDGAPILPTSVAYDPVSDKAVLTFATDLDLLPTGPGTYRLRIGTNEAAPPVPLQLRPAAAATSDFNTAGQVSLRFDAVPSGEAGHGIAVVVTKANLGAGVAPTISVFANRVSVVLNNSVGSKTTAAQLVNAINTSVTASALVRASIRGGDGSTDIATPNITYSPISLQFVGGLGSSFDTALDVGMLGTQGVIYSSAIDPQVYSLQFPGDVGEPGHREINIPSELHLPQGSVDTDAGITTFKYNFRSDYGFDPRGNPLFNNITANQKARAREVFEWISQVAGVQFVESANDGFIVVTGDMRAVNPLIATGQGFPYSISGNSAIGPAVVLDNAEAWTDGYGQTWQQRFAHELFHILGLGNSFELPPGSLMGNDGPAPTTNPLSNVNSQQGTNPSDLQFDNPVEPVFPSPSDVIHLQHVYRPEGKDIDLYKFQVNSVGLLSAETIAERRYDSSLLNTVLRLWKEVDVKNSAGQVVGKKKELISQNDDYYSNDSAIKLQLDPGAYWIGVSASGNADYDPTIEDTGIGGRSEGEYDLRLNFRPRATSSITDATGVALDGDGDGKPGGVSNFWFRAVSAANTLFVDKSFPSNGGGTLSSPRNNLASALATAQSGQVVRVLGNNGTDNNPTTLTDNFAYEIGFDARGAALSDGTTLQIPRGVTMMVDAGAIFKLRRSSIGVGSSSASIDHSGSALQVLGTPQRSVFFTSYDDATIGRDTNPDTVPPTPGSWGGLIFRRDIDAADQSRVDRERQGVFLNHVNQADIRYGGGNVVVDSVAQIISPVHLVDARPTVSFNSILFSADAAIAATPNSFEETTFTTPQFQRVTFTADYDRVGPNIHGNRLADANGNANSINGLVVRVATPAGNSLRKLTVSARFDDRDIVHVLPENLVIDGTPGGPLEEISQPSLALVVVTRLVGGGTLSAGSYNYRMTFVDAAGNEGPPSLPTNNVAVSNGDRVRLSNLLTAPAGFVARRIYRSAVGPNSPYTLIAQINSTDTTFTDAGASLNALLDERVRGERPRLDARLSIDPALVVKMSGSVISTNMGGQLIVEGQRGLETIITALGDDRFGAGGTFLTKNDGQQNTEISANNPNAARIGDWGGLFIGPYSQASIDNAVVAYAGGLSRVEGTFAAFNPIEIHQSEVRVANTLFERNEIGLGGQAPTDRFGRGFNDAGTVFVRGAQPTIVANTFQDNKGPAISINVNALDFGLHTDPGRSTGRVDRSPKYQENQGPLIRENRLDNNEINGMVVRGETVNTEVVMDDVDIVHVLGDRIYVNDFHTYGGVRLESSPQQSLVLKMLSLDKSGTNPAVPDFAGFVVNGRPLEITDRIGGILNVVGQPGFPVVMTSLHDCTVGAGYTPEGDPQNDTDNSHACRAGTVPTAADIIVLMGESGSMAFAQQFSVQLINDLELGLQARGIGANPLQPNRYGLVGFGGDTIHEPGHAHPLGANGALMGSAAEYAVAAGSLVDTGTLQDGYSAIDLAIKTYPIRPTASKFFLIVTNEDRDDLFPNLTYASTLTQVNSAGFILEGLYDIDISDGNGNTAVAIDASGNAYVANGSGGFTVNPGGVINSASGTTVTDYVDMSFATGGIAGDINQISLGGFDTTSFSAAMVNTIVRHASGITAAPGDWNGIEIEQFAHDRNVAIVTENESAQVVSPGSNSVPSRAQYVGGLGSGEKSADENRRLGYTIHGNLSAVNDMDVYSFTADAGTEIWLDIDRTTRALDTVIELLDVTGTILAQSDNSGAEQSGLQTVYTDGVTQAFPMQKTPPFEGLDRWTTNPRDAGMRVVLPGPVGTTNTYHVRVRSSNLKAGSPVSDLRDPARLGNGLTSGVYQLQMRLRELDDFGGTSVNFADIRYANVGISISGQPTHSPLSGEASETSAVNDALASAQPLGNLLASDRGTVSVAGNLTAFNDVDWYRLDVDYLELETNILNTVGATLDIDYADGLARADTVLSVYDSTGRLLLFSTDSNVAEDRPRPLAGENVSDLSRGTVGALDPYIGTVNLRTGNASDPRGSTGPYFIAVSSNARLPGALAQFTTKIPANPLVRIEPINSIARLVEDHIEDLGEMDQPLTPFSTSATPKLTNLFDNNSPIDYTLADIPLYITFDNNSRFDRSTLATVNPFTGQIETIVNANGDFSGDFFQFDVGDIAMRRDGRLFSFSLDVENTGNPNTPSDAASGNLLLLDTGTGAATVIVDDEIITYESDNATPPAPTEAHTVNGTAVGYGIQFNAMTFAPLGSTNVGAETFLAVGNRGDVGISNGVSTKRNIMYWFTNDETGLNLGTALPDAGERLDGAATNILEVGQILTGGQLIAPEATIPQLGDPNRALFNVEDRLTFDVNDGFTTTTFEFDAGPEVQQNIDVTNPARVIRDGNFFMLDPNRDPASTRDETIFQFDTGAVMVVNAGSASFQAGQTFTVNGLNGVAFAFEFVDDNVNGGNPLNPNAVTVDITNKLMNASAVAGQIALAVNGADGLGVTATVVGHRVSFVGDRTVTVGPGLGKNLVVEGDTNVAPILQAIPGNTPGIEGSTFTLQAGGVGTFVFEFDSNNAVQPNRIRVPYTAASTTRQVAQSIQSAIVEVGGFTAQLVISAADPTYGRVVVNGQLLSFSTNSAVVDLMSIQPFVLIPVEESFDGFAIGTAVADIFVGAVNARSNFLASNDLDRINFPPISLFPGNQSRTIAEAADFRGVPVWTDMLSTTGVSAGHVAIPFRAEDVAANRTLISPNNVPFFVPGMAQRIGDAINNVGIPGVTAVVNGGEVTLDNVSSSVTVITPPTPSGRVSPIIAGGQGPGGDITGLTTVNNQIYAISNRGGLYRLNVRLFANVPPAAPLSSLTATYIASSASDLQGLQFEGLSAGPQGVENGRYNNLLFGVTRQGQIYAFDTTGVLQPVLVDGRTSVSINIDSNTPLQQYSRFDFGNGGVQGAAFTTLNRNLWHQSTLRPFATGATPMDVRLGIAGNVGDAIVVDERQLDRGHGRLSSYDQSRFGQLDPSVSCAQRSGIDQFPECGNRSLVFGQGHVNGAARSYDFPGGADGSIVSNEFSLKGYAAADQPTLYFTYFLNSEDSNSASDQKDSIRVFVAGEDGRWVRVAHNDDSLPSVNLFDNTNSWRQARVPLGGFTGQDHLRLRFDFSSAGDMNVGDAATSGDELWAVAGSKLRDGATFQIDNSVFEFEMGYTLVPPSGVAIHDGETFTVTDGVAPAVTFEFDSDNNLLNPANVRVFLGAQQSSADVARQIASAVQFSGPVSIIPRVSGNRVNLQNATSVVQGLAPGFAQLGVVLEGNLGVNPGNVAVAVHQTMSSTEVATAIDGAIEPAFHSQEMIVASGLSYDDGDQFSLDDGVKSVTFEFDSGYVITLASGRGMTDGDTVRFFDSTTHGVVFEFDKDNLVEPGHVAVEITDGDSILSVANKFRQAIQTAAQSAPMGLVPNVLSGSRLQVHANSDVEIKFDSAPISVQGRPGVSQSVQFTVPGALGIQVPRLGAAMISDGETFTISDGTLTRTFEFDSNGAITAGNLPIPFSSLNNVDQIAALVIGTINGVGFNGLSLSYLGAGTGQIDLGSDSTHTIDLTTTSLVQLGRVGEVQDGEKFTISDGTLTVTFELDDDAVTAAGSVVIPFTANADPDAIATAIATTIGASGLTNVAPTTGPFGLINLGETNLVTVNSATLVNIVRTGVPGDNVVPIRFGPSATFTAANTAAVVSAAINSANLSATASVNPATPRRILINGNQLTLTVGTGNPPISFSNPIDIVKQDGNLIHVIGHSVVDRGPLGLQSALLPGDQPSAPPGVCLGSSCHGYNDNRRGQNNVFEGFYLDDIIIGFAERGEMVTGSAVDTSFVGPPTHPGVEILEGPYQLEIRRSTDYGTPPQTTFDTNDRFANAITLVAQPGDRLSDGETFTLSDGIRVVTFEYNDLSIRPGDLAFGAAPGNVPIDFNPSDADWQVATTIRDAINSQPVTQQLPGVAASLGDGTDGIVNVGPSTSNRVNLYGPVTLGTLQTTVAESNDTIATATDTGILGGNSPKYVVTGTIGDNPNFPLKRGQDVDLFRMFLNAGETVQIDIDASEIGSTLDSVLAVFSATGTPLVFNNAGVNTDELPSADPFLAFTAFSAGTYIIGVSGRTSQPVVAPFTLYNPNIEGTAQDGSTGFYRLSVSFGDPGRTDFITYHETGDQNLFRDQGQIVISSNTISRSSSFGIVADAGAPYAGGPSLNHPGETRVLREQNVDRLVPGVVLMNNLIFGSNSGGIQFSGQVNPADGAVPFGRIFNNTIVGGTTGILVNNNASPTLLNNVIANTTTAISIDASSQSSVVGGTVYQNNSSNNVGVTNEAFPTILSSTDPLFVNASGQNYYLAAGSLAIDSSIDSLTDRAGLITVRNPLGIDPSPVLAPERDVFGLLRVDDPNVSPPPGFGNNVFKDRGAVDRADFSGSVASMIGPLDEIFTGPAPVSTTPRDQSGVEGIVQLPNVPLAEFSIQLVDGVEPADPVNGVGVDDSTVDALKVFVLKDNLLQVEGVDYSFDYDATNNVIRLQPLAGVWETNRAYFIDLVNKDQHVFQAPDSTQLSDGVSFTVNNTVFEFETGFILQVPTSGVGDGNRFVIRNGSNPAVTFEFDRNNLVSTGNVRVPFTTTSTPTQIAEAMVTAISGVPSLGLTPRNIGNGRVQLGGTVDHTVTVTNSTLVLSGRPGVGAGRIAIPFVAGVLPSDNKTPQTSALQIAQAIGTAVQGQNLQGVRTTTRGYSTTTRDVVEVVIRGATTVSGFPTTFTSAIRDLAGNDLKSNNNLGSTTFTVFLGNGVDYGDAPASYTTTGINAASHAINPAMFLGLAIDAEPTGQASLAADSDDLTNLDDDDGVTFDRALSRNGTKSLSIVASTAGRLDAFVDYNIDGDFDDPGEKVLSNVLMAAGVNGVSFVVPGSIVLGTSFARFRFSTAGGLGPSGPAANGEVEDYLVTLVGAPWQNPVNPYDVSNDGQVTPLDALIQINFFNKYKPNLILPNPPPFVSGGTTIFPNPGPGLQANYMDFNGDGQLTPSDIIQVINYLNNPPASPEGEGESGLPAEAGNFASGTFDVSVAIAGAGVSSPGLQPSQSNGPVSAPTVAEFAFAVAPRKGLGDAAVQAVADRAEEVLDRSMEDWISSVASARRKVDALDDYFASFDN